MGEQMTEMMKQIAAKLGLPIIASVCVGIGSAFLVDWSMMKVLNQRVVNLEALSKVQEPLKGKLEKLEVTIERHEKALDRDFLRHEQIVATLDPGYSRCP